MKKRAFKVSIIYGLIYGICIANILGFFLGTKGKYDINETYGQAKVAIFFSAVIVVVLLIRQIRFLFYKYTAVYFVVPLVTGLITLFIIIFISNLCKNVDSIPIFIYKSICEFKFTAVIFEILVLTVSKHIFFRNILFIIIFYAIIRLFSYYLSIKKYNKKLVDKKYVDSDINYDGTMYDDEGRKNYIRTIVIGVVALIIFVGDMALFTKWEYVFTDDYSNYRESHLSYYLINDDWIIGKTAEEIQKRYGSELEQVNDMDSSVLAYNLSDSSVEKKYYIIEFDEQGVAISHEVKEVF